MTFAFSVLGSGSGGNATVLALQDDSGRERLVLVDCGLSPRATKKRLAELGMSIAEITDILLTHLDQDHFRPTWVRTVEAHGINVHVHKRHRTRAVASGLSGRALHLFQDEIDLGPSTRAEAVLFAHDQLGTAGFIVEHDGRRLGFATDLGRVPNVLHDRFRDLDALAIESNYDRELQVTSARPEFLKRRIMGGAGHLSNDESLDAVLALAPASELQHIVTLHLSRQCNHANLVQRLYAARAPHLLDKLTITSQHQPTPRLQVEMPSDGVRRRRDGEQLALF